MCLQCGYPSGSLSPSHPPLPFVPDARPRVFPRVEHFTAGGVQCSTAQTVPEQVEYRMVPTGASLEAARARSGIEIKGKTMAETFETLLASRSEEHTSEIQSRMRISYAEFFMK